MTTFTAPAAALALLATYQVKNLKTFSSYGEGPGFTCTLYRDGKLVAHAEDMANGGPVEIWWEDAKAEKVVTPVYQSSGELKDIPLSPEHSRFMLLARDVLPTDEFNAGDRTVIIHPDDETLISHIVDQVAIAKKAKSMLKNKVLLLNPAGELVTIQKHKPTPDIIAKLRVHKTYSYYRIINAMPEAEALAIITKHIGG